jgi:hypothetical protein
MAAGTAPEKTKTIAQLRNDIDAGRTGDKTAWPDPAAVPLGVDEEAAGTPPSSDAVTHAHDEEISRPATSRRRRAGAGIFISLGIGLVAFAFIVLLIVAL